MRIMALRMMISRPSDVSEFEQVRVMRNPSRSREFRGAAFYSRQGAFEGVWWCALCRRNFHISVRISSQFWLMTTSSSGSVACRDSRAGWREFCVAGVAFSRCAICALHRPRLRRLFDASRSLHASRRGNLSTSV